MAPVGIEILDDLVPDCDEIVRYMNDSMEWKASGVGVNNEVSSVRTSQTLHVPFLSYQNPPMICEMNRRVWSALDEYAKKYEFGFSGVEDCSVQRYQVGDHYDAHVDSGPSMPRIVSAVLYLNTVKKGGETRFTLFDYSVKPIAGRLIIFPSNYVYKHEALPPKKGIKIAAAYWARG